MPPRPTPFANERSMVATAKNTSSTTSPAHRSLPPLSLPAADLLSRAQIKCCLVLRDRDRIIALILKIHGTVLLKTYPFSSDDSRRLFTQTLFPRSNQLKQAMFLGKCNLGKIRAGKVSHNDASKAMTNQWRFLAITRTILYRSIPELLVQFLQRCVNT